ncbi:MAG TPA: tetratricopeptide repeat protein [Stellaceae bacterium]|jgi:hypothetical protein
MPVTAVAVAPFRIPANSNERLPEPAPASVEAEPFASAKPVLPAEPPTSPPPTSPPRSFPPPTFPPPPLAAGAPADGLRAPRYGRAIAPLPAHLIASVKPPPRESLPPAQVRLRPVAAATGKPGTLQGTPFGPRRGGRGWRGLVVGLICVAGAIVISRSDFVANLVDRIGKAPHGDSAAAAPVAVREPPVLPVAVEPPQVAAATDRAPPTGAVAAPAAAPAPVSDRMTDLTIKAKAGDTGAEYDLGLIFARGDGVPQDYAKAVGWFREAAINGNVPAQFNLAVLYEHGLGVPQNMNEALIWYHSAAARNYPSAQYNLAISYAQGHGTPQDLVAAARWYLRAAQQGMVAAMVNFAILCEGGQGTDKSPTMAYAWYRAAGSRGDEDAAKRADELYRQFSESVQKAADMALGTAEDSIHEPLLAQPASGKSAAAKPVQTPG